MERDQELIDGFLSRKPAAETEFVIELERCLQAEIRTYSPNLWPELSDLVQSALLKVCKLREKPATAQKIQPPIPALARWLMMEPASKEKRVKHWPRLKKSQEPAVGANQESAVTLKEMLEIAVSLPRGMAKTMLAYEAHLAGEGPALPEALGAETRTARRRLVRAQAAVIRIALGEDVEITEEDQDE
jgi:hypothetical protein